MYNIYTVQKGINSFSCLKPSSSLQHDNALDPIRTSENIHDSFACGFCICDFRRTPVTVIQNLNIVSVVVAIFDIRPKKA